MHECPWCGRENLNVYAYCLGCGRGFDDPHPEEEKPAPRPKGLLQKLGLKKAS